MKKMNLIGLILGCIGAVNYLYNLFVVQPALESASALDSPSQIAAYSSMRDQSDILGLAGTSLAGIGFILALIGYFKTKETKGLLVALFCAVLAFLNFWTSFGRVV
jgi:hypothetical protein